MSRSSAAHHHAERDEYVLIVLITLRVMKPARTHQRLANVTIPRRSSSRGA
jgi:hypothetical protein